jgi:histone H3/H4
MVKKDHGVVSPANLNKKMRQYGVEMAEKEAREEISKEVNQFTEKLIKSSLTNKYHRGKKKLSKEDVKLAAKHM